MEPDFWHDKWDNQQTSFHLSDVNPLLTCNFEALSLTAGQTVFVPLCGKTLDIAWLKARQLSIVGVELHEPAVQALMNDLGTPFQVTNLDGFHIYRTEQVTIWVGDFFALTPDHIGPIDAVYDRAAIVALPAVMRATYSRHLIFITQRAKQLVINYVYDQSLMNGPPFSVPEEELLRHYEADYSFTQLYHGSVEGGLKGRCPASESVWLLQ